MKYKRIFLLILDSLGVGESKDAYKYESIGASTLGHINENCPLFIPNLQRIGFLNTLNMTDDDKVEAYYTIAHPTNIGVDSLSGHYEMVGANLDEPYQRFPTGFDEELLQNISNITGRRIIGNICCTNDDIINDLGDTERNYGSLIVYTSGDSNLQVAAHEDAIPIKTLYDYCERIKELTIKDNIRISRIIARPFTGENKYTFITSARKEFVNNPKKETILNLLEKEKLNIIGIGKVNDIFKNNGITKSIKAINNSEAINKLVDIMNKDFTGLCITNLSDFDEIYGHNRDIEGYAKAIEELDVNIPIILNKLNIDDMLIITADHGCDPTFAGNGHTRENVPVIIYSRNFKEPKRLKELSTLADIGNTIADNFKITELKNGTSFLNELK